MNNLKQLHLVLYFTEGVSLRDWASVGMFDRETGLYRALRAEIRKITFVTYGGKNELAYIPKLKELGIEVVYNRWQVPMNLYRLWVARFLPLFWKKPWVVKSNQMRGAGVAMQAAQSGRGKFVVRCGYLFANFTEREFGADAPRAIAARALESRVFHYSDLVIVTTERMKLEINKRYGVERNKIRVIPNYVLVDLFTPTLKAQKNERLKVGFVGRLAEQKNLFTLLDAVEGLDVDMQIVGGGEQCEALQEEINKRDLPITLLGNLPHDELPRFLQSCDMFVLPSLFEGHPKALIEAMACGLPVIGTDVQGINDVITDRKNGMLCGTSAASIREAILILMRDETLRTQIGRNARHFVANSFPLSRVVQLE